MTSLWEWFRDLDDRKHDPRTNDWFLVSTPETILSITAVYIYFCVWAGPKYMKGKPAHTFRNTLIGYNFIQVLLSAYIVYETLTAAWLFDYSWTCQPIKFISTPNAMRVASAIHLYFLCKFVEFLDTVFFVLRKKQSQITFLHLYHHASMPILTWIEIRYAASGHPTFLVTMNSLVHVFMYTYYLLAALGPAVQKYLWWKKYMTILQLVQFCIICVHSLQVFYNGCDIPKVFSMIIVLQSTIFALLFGSFYYKSNVKSKVKHATTVLGDTENTSKNLKSN